MIDLNRERVVALSNLAAWTVRESADYIATSLGGAELHMARQKTAAVKLPRRLPCTYPPESLIFQSYLIFRLARSC